MVLILTFGEWEQTTAVDGKEGGRMMALPSCLSAVWSDDVGVYKGV